MKHLSGLDASFLHFETAEMPMHVGALHLLAPPEQNAGDFADAVKRHVADRLHLASVFTKKLACMPLDLANPVWVDDDDLDLDYHIRQLALPRPGTQAQLEACVARLHSGLLDRSRPLWEFYLIDGLASGQIGFYTKIHHAALDGQGAMLLAQALLDVTPVPRPVDAAPARPDSSETPGARDLLRAALSDTATQCARLLRGLPTGLKVAVGLLRRTSQERAEPETRSGRLAPRTPLNGSITNQRAFATLRFGLQESLAIGKAAGATLNDVVLALVAGALRDYLGQRGALPVAPLVAAVPVSLRADGDALLNNQVSMLLMKLASDEADPAARLQAIVKASARLKRTVSSVKSVLPTEFPSLGLPWLMSGLAVLYGRTRMADALPPVANVVVSNVPGPRVPLYLAGARILANFPASIVTHGLGLNVTVQSYDGSLDVGIVACRRAMPDIAAFAEAMRVAHAELAVLVRPACDPAPIVVKKRAPATPAAPRKSASKRAPRPGAAS